jgi:SAM-dependent methyltransferase
MLRSLVPFLICPWCSASGLELAGTEARVQNGSIRCPSCSKSTVIKRGVWLAMGPHKRQRSIAQITNVWPTPLFYESLWRPGALGRFSGRRFPLREELGEMCAALNPGPGMTFVDVACSEGLYARTLAANGAAVFAVEHSVPMLRKVVRRSGDLPVVAVQAMAQRMPFLSGSLDGAAIGGSMNEIGDRVGATTEMARVIQPTGKVFSMHLNRGRSTAGRLLQTALGPSGIVFDTPEGWRRDFAAGGLTPTNELTDAIVARMTLTRRPSALDSSVAEGHVDHNGLS